MTIGSGAHRRPMPADARIYRSIGPFDNQSIPKGLLAEHRLKPDVWARLELDEGTVTFVWDDSAGGLEKLTAPTQLIVPPEVPHHLEADSAFRLSIHFCSIPKAEIDNT